MAWPQTGPRVVIVDDHAAMRAALRDALEDEGATVIGEADEGSAGVELATRLEPDVVLMDLRLPGISGLEATRHIKQLRPAVQVLILTAYACRRPSLDSHLSGWEVSEAGRDPHTQGDGSMRPRWTRRWLLVRLAILRHLPRASP